MKYDAVIIGFGKGGKTLAGALAKQGKSVALIEESKEMYGGTCINVGCIPSKSLIHSSARFQGCFTAASDKKERTVMLKAQQKNYEEAIEEKIRVTSLLRQKNYDKLNSLDNVTIYDGTASFQTKNRILIKGEAGELLIEGEDIFINTGSRPFIPEIAGIKKHQRVYTSEELMSEKRLPENLVIIGAGYIGMEFASMYQNFGSQVTVIADSDTFLPREDRDIAEAIKQQLERQGVCFLMNTRVLEIEEDGILCEQGERKEKLIADTILLATGRRPNTMELKPENAGIALTKNHAILVDDRKRTTVPNIWAMGDVTGGLSFTYMSLDDYRIVMEDLQKDGFVANTRSESLFRTNIAFSVFMEVPYAKVGLNEQEAKAKNIPYQVASMPAAAIPKAQVLRKTNGMLKALIHAETKEILGVMLLCEEAPEIINIVKLAMDYHATSFDLMNQIFTHPTMAEALNDLFSLFA